MYEHKPIQNSLRKRSSEITKEFFSFPVVVPAHLLCIHLQVLVFSTASSVQVTCVETARPEPFELGGVETNILI